MKKTGLTRFSRFLSNDFYLLAGLRWGSSFHTVSCEMNAVHGVVMPVFPLESPSMPMSSDTIRTNNVHLLSSKTCSTHLLFIDMQHIAS